MIIAMLRPHPFVRIIPQLVIVCGLGMAAGQPADAAARPEIRTLPPGDKIRIIFSGNLQASAQVSGPFTNVVGALSPLEVTLGEGEQGYWRAALSQVATVAAGPRDTMAIRTDGTLWAWGGQGNSTGRPVKVGSDTDWKVVAPGGSHILAIKTDRTLWAWGSNYDGQLGLEVQSSNNRPTRIGNESDWVSVTAGDRHSVAIRSDGSLWSWGGNSSGQLGTGTITGTNRPVQVGIRRDWLLASAGYTHTIAVRQDGTLWAWGGNSSGQLGDGTQFRAVDPIQIGTSTNWVGAAAGTSHTLALQSGGTLWAWGSGSGGQLGNGTSGNQARSLVPQQIADMTGCRLVDVGYQNSGAAGSDGHLWLWGSNETGQLGNGTDLDSPTPVLLAALGPWQSLSLGDWHMAALHQDGTLWTWGRNDIGQLGNGSFSYFPTPVKAETVGAWRTLACGTAHSVALREDGTIWAWGQNRFGQLGFGTFQGTTHPMRVGSDADWRQISAGQLHTLGLKADGSLWAWGSNDGGQLGAGKAAGFKIANPMRVDASTDWDVISTGEKSNAAIRRDGTLWTWGRNDNELLGLGTNASQIYQPVKVGTNANWRAVSVGKWHMAAIRTDGSLWSWGYNSWGQLGTGSSAISSPRPRQVGTNTHWRSVAAGYAHCVALRDNGTLWAWGHNTDGELGIGSWTNTNQPVQIGGDTTWTAVSACVRNTVAIQADGSVWTWGENFKGQLGIGLVTTGPFLPKEYGIIPRQAVDLPPVKAVSAGDRYMATIDRDGNLWTWGDNEFGQAAQPISALPAEIAVDSSVGE